MEEALIDALAIQMAQLRTQVQAMQERLDEETGDTMDDLFLRMGGGDGGDGGSCIGNTYNSVVIEGHALFESAADSNVKVTTKVRKNADDETENVIKIGVYYV